MRIHRIFALTVILLALSVTGCGGDKNADEAFTTLAGNYLQGMLPMNPEWATNLGDHRFDGEVSDLTKDGFKAAVTFNRAYLDSLGDIDPEALKNHLLHNFPDLRGCYFLDRVDQRTDGVNITQQLISGRKKLVINFCND
jgi:hypothetical protein